MNDNVRDVLRHLAAGWTLCLKGRIWRLKKPNYLRRFRELPGGNAIIDELVASGYIDNENNLTDAGSAALGLLDEEDSRVVRTAKTRVSRPKGGDRNV